MRKIETGHGIFTDLVNDEGEILKTAEEVYEGYLKQLEQIDISPEPTTEERITKLEEEKSILAENVYQLASILEIMLGGTEDGQTEATTTDTDN